jgi:hypothetical protein
MFVKRLRRRSGATQFEASLRGDLERALAQVQYHMDMARTFQWWFLLPAAIILLVDMSYGPGEPSLSSIATAIVGFSAAMLLARFDIRCVHLPNYRDLESLRTKLTGEA